MERTPAAFAQRAQNVVMTLLVISLVMVAQQFSQALYKAGAVSLFFVVFLQIAVSNVTPTAGRRKTLTKSAIILGIIVLIFLFSIWITPTLVGLGQTKRF
jgi:MFS-type transporter involved in bile tolerance (Atg22 family)